MQKPLWHFDAEYMTASFIINCFLFLVLVFNQASIYDGAVNTTVTTLLNSMTEQQEDKESYNDGYSLGVYIAGGSAVLGVISAIGYAGYKWYKSYANNKYISHESEIELGRNNSQYFCPFSTTDSSLLIGENLSKDKANGDVSESYVSFRGNSMEDITPIIGDSAG